MKKLEVPPGRVLQLLGISVFLIIFFIASLLISLFSGVRIKNIFLLAINFIIVTSIFAIIIMITYARINKAKALEKDGKLKEAINIYKQYQMHDKVKELWEKQCILLNEEAKSAVKDGFLDEAIKLYREAGEEKEADKLSEILNNNNEQKKIKEAQDYEKEGKFDWAIIYFHDLDMMDDVERVRKLKLLSEAKEFEKQSEFKKAAIVYESLNMWDDVFRVAKKRKIKTKINKDKNK